MPIQCQLCQREFSKMITNSHLKTHNCSTDEYKKQFGEKSIASSEYREEKSNPRSAATKRKISAGVKRYAKSNKDELRQRALKAIQTKRKRGQDLAFFRGKKHSVQSAPKPVLTKLSAVDDISVRRK